MITIKVLHKSTGKPAQGKRVALYIDRFLASGVTQTEWTDEEGLAHFDVESVNGEVYVDGSVKHKGRLAGHILVHV